MYVYVSVCCKCIGHWLIIQHWKGSPPWARERQRVRARELTALWVNSSCWQGCHLFYSLIQFNFQRKLRHSNSSSNNKKTETISIAFTFSLRLIKMRHKFQLKYATAAQQRQRDVALQLRAAVDVAAGRRAELGLWKLLHVKWSMEQMSVA